MPTSRLSPIVQNRIYLPFLRHMAHQFTVQKKLPTPGRCFMVNLVFSLYLRSSHTSIDGMTYFIDSLGCGRLKKLWQQKGGASLATATPAPSSGNLQVLYGKVVEVRKAS